MSTVTVTSDLVYAHESGIDLALDIYRPDVDGLAPTVLYLHGGAWVRGDKAADSDARLRAVASLGVAVVSMNYRLIDAAIFPAQIHDVKGAVRWLRANGLQHGLATERLAVWGASAGATLGSLLALTAGDEEYEGTVGGNPAHSSAVQAAVHWFGPTDLTAGASRSWLEKLILLPPTEPSLFGSTSIDDVATIARAASPLRRVHTGAPPFLIAHGDRDRLLPIGDSEALHDALSREGTRSTFLSLAGAGHEDHLFDHPSNLAMVVAFLRAHLEVVAA